jgi:sulfur carrier protein ThiS
MPLHIFLNATLRRYVPGYDPFRGLFLEVAPGATVAQVIAQLGLPAQEVTLIMVDGRSRGADFVLTGDERLGLFPPIGGG